ERQHVAREQLTGVPIDLNTNLGLLARDARDVEVERRHDVLDQAAAVEALSGRLPAALVARPELCPGDLYDGVAQGPRGIAVGFEGLGGLRPHRAGRCAHGYARAK